jgi:predicted nucleotidyltransferase/HEPN domain-containing protein
MKKSLRHLPKHKQEELQAINDIISKFDGLEMIILFGSYARGDWVEDRYVEDGVTYTYFSDYDLLLVWNNKKNANSFPLQDKIEHELKRSIVVTNVSLIMHSINFFNRSLAEGQYFFSDIKNEGIVLFDTGTHQLARRRKLNHKEIQEQAKDYYDKWFKSANEFLEGFEFHLSKEHYNNAAFQLHQSTERYYYTILLVHTLYKPKLHDIEKLGAQASSHNHRFASAFPQNNDEEKRLYDLLKHAYIDSRYKNDYAISQEELQYLGLRVDKLKDLVEEICSEYIESIC